MYVHDHLLDEYSLMDLAYIYSWRRNAPMRLRYRFPDLPASLSAASQGKEEVPTAPNDGKRIVIAASSVAPSPQTPDTPQPSPKPVVFQYTTPSKPSAKASTPSPQLPKGTPVPQPAATTPTPPARKNGMVASNGVHPSLRHILPAPAKTPMTNGVGAFAPKAAEKNRVGGTTPSGAPVGPPQPEPRQDESPAAKRPHLDSRQCKEAVVS
ncbi:unnamed protein product [Ixodes hexagonus]